MRRRFLAAALGMSMAVAMTPAAAFAEETSTEEATEVVSEVASEDETGAEEESSEAETEAFDYSEGYDEKGFFEGVKALDYVTLLDYSHMELSDEIIPSDEAVQSQIDKTLSSYTKTNQITDENRLIEDGDTVNIDYVGSVDGVEFEGGMIAHISDSWITPQKHVTLLVRGTKATAIFDDTAPTDKLKVYDNFKPANTQNFALDYLEIEPLK